MHYMILISEIHFCLGRFFFFLDFDEGLVVISKEQEAVLNSPLGTAGLQNGRW